MILACTEMTHVVHTVCDDIGYGTVYIIQRDKTLCVNYKQDVCVHRDRGPIHTYMLLWSGGGEVRATGK